MAFGPDYTLTLTGVAQRLSSVLSDTTLGGPDDVSLRGIILQPDGANAGVCYFGASSSVSSSAHAFSLPAGSSGVPPAPFVLEFNVGGPMRLSEIWVIGTLDESLHIGVVRF